MAQESGKGSRTRNFVGLMLRRDLATQLDEVAARERRSRAFMVSEFVLEGLKRYWAGKRRARGAAAVPEDEEPGNGVTTVDGPHE